MDRAIHKLLKIVLICSIMMAQAALTIDAQRAQSFFGGKKAKAAWVYGGKLYFVDFSASNLEIKQIRTDSDNSCNLQISLDGTRVAYVKSGKVYITKMEENSSMRIEVAEGTNPTWWIHPETGKEYILLQRGEIPGNGNGMFTVELDKDSKPVGGAKFFLMDPMANAGRSPDGRFLANNDEEHVRCWRGHGLYEVDKPLAVENAEIKYWVYMGDEGWYANGKYAYKAYCNGAMSPDAPGGRFYGYMLHMGSGHTEIYIRKTSEGYQNRPLVRIEDAPASCPDKTILETSRPEIIIPGPKWVGATGAGSDTHWGYSDWSTHPDYIIATGGTGTSSSKNKRGYLVNITKKAGTPDFALRFADGNVAEPDLWVDSNNGPSSNSRSGIFAPPEQLNARFVGSELHVRSGTAGKAVLTLRSLNGELLLETAFHGASHVLSTNSLPAGFYSLSVQAGDWKGTKTLLLP